MPLRLEGAESAHSAGADRHAGHRSDGAAGEINPGEVENGICIAGQRLERHPPHFSTAVH